MGSDADMPVMIKIKGCPMVQAKLRKEAKCPECSMVMAKGSMAYRSMLFGGVGGIQRFHRFCFDCAWDIGTEPKYI